MSSIIGKIYICLTLLNALASTLLFLTGKWFLAMITSALFMASFISSLLILKKYKREDKPIGVKIPMILFFVSMTCFWLSLLWLAYSWANFHNTAHNISSTTTVCLPFIILFFGITIMVRYRRQVLAKNQRNPMKTFILVSGVALAVFIHFFSWYSLCYDIGRTAYGCLPISAKTIDNNNCYFIVDNVLQLGDARKVQCSKDVYDALIIDEDVRYYMSFRTLSLTPDNGYLEMIDTKNYIDNRTHPTVED